MQIVYRCEHCSSKVYCRTVFYRNRSRALNPCKLYDVNNVVVVVVVVVVVDDNDDDDKGLCTID
jgi:hypothetical protein